MMNDLDNIVQSDFDKARNKEIVSKIFSLLKQEEDELFSLQDVKSILKPKSTTYKGILPVKLTHIVGSEGRYQDFNRLFLPKSNFLRARWVNINKAHYDDKNLPPIKAYEIGGLYFVRDGNHRVSVAKIRGMEFIDAEVITLNSEIQLDPKMSLEEIKKAVIRFEKERFYHCTDIKEHIPQEKLNFTSIGRYDDIIAHINGHKYYLNLDHPTEIPFNEAMISWYNKVFTPIINSIIEDKILSRFPGRTPADLYVWICRHWDELKNCYGPDYPLEKAAKDYKARFGTNPVKNLYQRLKGFFTKKR